jgi:energy-coupling factor transporter ATP-binding protein EcfA2
MTYLIPILAIVGTAAAALLMIQVWQRAMALRYRMRYEAEESRIRIAQLTREREHLQAKRPQPATESTEDPEPRPAPPIPSPTPPDDLRRAIAAGECVLFAGVGLAAQAGLPSWRQLLESVIDRAEKRSPHELWQSVRTELEDGEISVAVEFVRARVGDEDLEEMLREEVARTTPRDPSTLARLAKIPFSGAITLDWSGFVRRCLSPDDAPPITPQNVDLAIDAFREGDYFFLNAAGDIGEPGSSVITVEDMRELAAVNREYARFVVSLLTTRSLLFLGSDIDGIEEFLDCFPSRMDSRRHWALVPWEPQIELEKERFERRFQVELLPYAADDGHGEATEDFTRLLQGTHRQPRRRRPGQPLEAEQLRELKLRNIGPFHELQVELDPHTILLGDNGSGKSSLLRAIALALTGDSADERIAGRMLCTTASQGDVELITDRGAYRTRLLREGKRGVRIESDGLLPIQASGWLALGFPPLRGVSVTDPRGPTGEIADEPTPDDLLPLLSNGPDQRLDGLKQWVVNTATRAEQESARDSRDAEMLESFFRILGDLTPGTEFTYREVDHKTWEVLLDSPDGPLSFDLLSRGMTSLMGWVGILLQRLYEVYGNRDGPPEEQRALVLVDEIDVHLHPEWQHLVLPLIASHFPNIQLIVTTHSPLIVGSAQDGEVRVLSRVDNVPTVRRLEGRFSGWRSDQILTSPAFEMESTRGTSTAAMHREYRDLLARGETPEVNERAKQLYDELEAEMPAGQETPAGREAVTLFRSWLRERFESSPPPEQDAIVREAEDYLSRLYSEQDK